MCISGHDQGRVQRVGLLRKACCRRCACHLCKVAALRRPCRRQVSVPPDVPQLPRQQETIVHRQQSWCRLRRRLRTCGQPLACCADAAVGQIRLHPSDCMAQPSTEADLAQLVLRCSRHHLTMPNHHPQRRSVLDTFFSHSLFSHVGQVATVRLGWDKILSTDIASLPLGVFKLLASMSRHASLSRF